MRGKKSIAKKGHEIMKEAKKLRKKHPNEKWTSLVAKAAKKIHHKK
jgi:hypothetical protein